MKRTDLVKGFVMKPIMEILKKDYNIKSPTPSSLFVNESDGDFKIIYKNQRVHIDFSNLDLVKNLLNDIKNNPMYEKV